MYKALHGGKSVNMGQGANTDRPRVLPSQTHGHVFDRNCKQGPPHSWKQLHKLVNLEGRSLSPQQHFFFSFRYFNDETGRGQTWCTQTSLYEADAHLQRRHTVHQGEKVQEIGSCHSEPVYLSLQDTGTATVSSGQTVAQWWETLKQLICLSSPLCS